MPIYEYRCGACRKKFEKIVLSSGGATSKTVCTKCGAAGAERLASRFATASRGAGDDLGAGGMDDGFGGSHGEDWGDDASDGIGDDGGIDGEDD